MAFGWVVGGGQVHYDKPLINSIRAQDVALELRKEPPLLVTRGTTFNWEFKEDYNDMMAAIAVDDERNQLVVTDILAESADPSIRAVVVCDRKKQMELLQKMLVENFRSAERYIRDKR